MLCLVRTTRIVWRTLLVDSVTDSRDDFQGNGGGNLQKGFSQAANRRRARGALKNRFRQ